LLALFPAQGAPKREVEHGLLRANLFLMDSVDSSSAPAEPPVPTFRVLIPSPIGPLALELAGLAVQRLVVAPKPALAEGFTPLSKSAAPELVEDVVGQLAEYFAGARQTLDAEPDLGEIDSFARRVLRETCRIPYGKTRTYRELAGLVGRTEDAEAVRTVLLANPVPVFIPCHRLVLGSGKLGAWVGGSERKRWLLGMEKESGREIDGAAGVDG
jgi:methylated-DNA-[protein]-cysteine S-methyltransferase